MKTKEFITIALIFDVSKDKSRRKPPNIPAEGCVGFLGGFVALLNDSITNCANSDAFSKPEFQ